VLLDCWLKQVLSPGDRLLLVLLLDSLVASASCGGAGGLHHDPEGVDRGALSALEGDDARARAWQPEVTTARVRTAAHRLAAEVRMTSLEQLELTYNDSWRDRELARVLRQEARIVVEECGGVKAVAYELGMEHPDLSKKLDERDRHYLRIEDWVGILRRDRAARVLGRLAEALGYDITRRRELSDREWRERVEASLERNPTLARAIYDEAFGSRGKP
jgi:hypothetical protein